MIIRTISLVTVIAFVLAFSARLPAQDAEENAVRALVNQYFKGHATGSAEEMRSAFLPSAHIEGIRNGEFTSWTAEEYSSRFTGKAAADEPSRKRTIDSVSVSGDAAMVKATLVHGPTTFTDYFVMLKVGSQWKIANKVYSSKPTK